MTALETLTFLQTYSTIADFLLCIMQVDMLLAMIQRRVFHHLAKSLQILLASSVGSCGRILLWVHVVHVFAYDHIG